MPLLPIHNECAPGWVKAGGAVFQVQAFRMQRIKNVYHIPPAQRKTR